LGYFLHTNRKLSRTQFQPALRLTRPNIWVESKRWRLCRATKRLRSELPARLQTNRAQVVIQQALAEVDQRGRMNTSSPNCRLRGEVPAGMVTEQFDG